jgi:hypothetical protein
MICACPAESGSYQRSILFPNLSKQIPATKNISGVVVNIKTVC